MNFGVNSIIIGFVVLALVCFVARLAFRWTIRLALVGLMFIILLGGGMFWWWIRSSTSQQRQNKPRPAPTRRASSH